MRQPSKQITRYRPRTIEQDPEPQDAEPKAWTEGYGFRFDDGVGKRVLGQNAAFDDALYVEPRFLAKATDPDAWLVVCEQAVLMRDQFDTVTDVTPVGWQDANEIPDLFTATEINQHTIINHAADVPYYKPTGGVGVLSTLGGYSAGSCNAMRAFKEHLFALGVTSVSGSHVKWSASGGSSIPTNWTPGAGNDAGDADLTDTRGVIVDGALLGGNLIIYKENSCYVCSYVGGNTVFAFRPLFHNIGLIARNCALAHRGFHLAWTLDDIVLHDGVRPQSIIDAKNRRWLFAQIDPDFYQNSFAFLNVERNEAWFCFPETGKQYPSLALTWSFEDAGWGVRELYTDGANKATKGAIVHLVTGVAETLQSDVWQGDSDTWGSDSTLWNEDIFTQYDEKIIAAQAEQDEIIALDVSTTNIDDTAINSRLAKVGLDCGEPSFIKLVQRVIPHITAANGTEITIRLGEQESRDAPISWGNTYTYVVGSMASIGVFQRGRYIAIEFSESNGDYWEIAGFDLDYKVKGFF